jgi:response regulator RpfG family c-di-GMP phosphodiesterase
MEPPMAIDLKAIPVTLNGANSSLAGQTVASLVDELLRSSLVLMEDWQALPGEIQHELRLCTNRHSLMLQLVALGLLTEYQAVRIEAGKTFGLVIGNYRVLDRIGAGGMGVVFRAEHMHLRRQVAIKALSMSLGSSELVRVRFDSEMRAVAQLQHPNIVTALDAGDLPSPNPTTPGVHYFVMEYVPGQDLESYVQAHGPMPPAQACDLAYQVASALAEAHKHGLIHRDLKPSNVLRMPEGQAKLLDFGLAQHITRRVTEPGTMLGTLDYMAPEQAIDAGAVDARVDIFGLGGTLYWCLTGHAPYPESENTLEGLLRRKSVTPSIRHHAPHLPAELDALVGRMMAGQPSDRYPNAQAVMAALLSFLRGQTSGRQPLTSWTNCTAAELAPHLSHGAVESASRVHRVLLVDDEPGIRQFCRLSLLAEDVQCDEAGDGEEVFEAVEAKGYDLVMLDMQMPGLSGLEVYQRLRSRPASPHLKVIMFSGQTPTDDMAQVLALGVDDFLTKPCSAVQLRARVRTLLRLKDAEDMADILNRDVLELNHQMEHQAKASASDLVQVRNALVQVLARLVEKRGGDSKGHLMRMQRFSRVLAEECGRMPAFSNRIDEEFINALESCLPLYDIGKVGLPDHILHKPGKLDADERLLMQTHTIVGSEMLRGAATQHGPALAFLQMAFDVARHHHERWDGQGYPDRLAGADIPLAARIVALADVYDALRSRRVYKPALSHDSAVRLLLNMPGHFDPMVVQAFRVCNQEFDRIYREMTE